MKVQINDHSKEVKEAKNAGVLRALEAIGITAEGYAKLYEVRVDTGRLRNSITHDVRANEEKVYIGTNVEYAPYIEFGTSRGIEPTPFLENAVKNHLPEYKELAKKYLSN